MTTNKEPLPEPLFLAIFVLGSLLLAAGVIGLGMPDEILVVAFVGIAYPASVYPSRFYLVIWALFIILVVSTTLIEIPLTALVAAYLAIIVLLAFALGETLFQANNERTRRESALLESQSQLEEAQSIAHIAHFTLDIAKDRGYWSKEMYAISGLAYTAEQPPFSEWAAMIHPDDRARVIEAQRATVEEGARLDIVFRLVRPDGQVCFLHSSGYRKQRQDDQPPILIGTVADITEQESAQQATRQAEERVRTLLESAPLAILIVDGAGKIVQTNRYVEMVFGYTPDEVVGQHLDMLLPEEARAVHRHHYQAYLKAPDVRVMGRRRELTGVSKSGKKFPVEIGLSSMEVSGQEFGIAWVADISERRRAEDAVRQSEQYFKLLHETSRELSTTLDLAAIHDSSYRAISQVMDCDGLIISSYSPEDHMIRGVYARLEGAIVNAEEFPPIPLEPEGQGTQSVVIRTGRSLIVPDYQERLKSTATTYQISQDGIVGDDVTPDDGQITRSAVLVPLELEGAVVGIMQVLSYRLDAYTSQQLRFLESLATHIVLARKNALLLQQAQRELAERKQAEQALQTSEERYRTISDLASDYAYSFAVGAGGVRTIEWIAGAFVQITGYTVDELPSIGGWARMVYRPDIPAARRHTRKLLTNQSSVGEFRIMTRERGLRWLRDYARPVWDDREGRVVRIIGAVQDITERRRAEDALVESEKLYRSVFEGTSLGLGIIDANGRILAFNGAILRPGGYEPAELEKAGSVRRFFYDPKEYFQVFKTVRAGVAVDREPVRFKRKDGTPYDILLSLIPISISGKPGWHGIVEDLSAQKQFEAEIRLLFHAQEHHLAELEALRRVSLDITSQLDLNPLLEELIGDALSLLDAESGAIYIYDADRDVLELQVEVGTDALVGTVIKRGEGLAGRVLDTGKPLIVQNYSQWDNRAHVYDGYGFASVLGVPIVWGSEMLGVIDAVAQTPQRVFSQEDAGLLSRFADQAAIAIHNARLYEAEQKARTLAETLYATSVALSHSLDLDERLDVFLRNLHSLVPYDSANVMLLEPDGRLVIRAARGYEHFGIEGRKPGTRLELSQLAGVQEVITTLRTVHIPDTSQHKGWVDMTGTGHVACWIGVPLIADGEVIGLYCLDKTEPGFFTREHRDAAETLAAPAAIAIQNARLFESETRQLKLAQTLQKVGALLTTQMALDEVFEHIFDLLAEVVDFDSVSVFLIDEAGEVTLGAQRGIDDVDRLARSIRLLGPRPLKAHWWNMTHATIINDTQSDPDWVPMEGTQHVRAWMGAPLVVKGLRIGVLNVDSSKPNVFEPRIAETVAAFANQAAVAIENARLFTQTETRSRRLQLLNEITRIGTETLDLATLLDGTVKVAAQLIGGDGASITLWDEEDRLTTVATVSGNLNEPFSRIKLTAAVAALTATALQEGHPLAIEDYYPHQLDVGEGGQEVASSLLLPLQVGQHNLGALFIDFKLPHHFSDDEIAWSNQAAELIALTIAKAEVYEDLERRVEERTAELKAANDRLVALTRLKDEFVSNVSHELRTPIASIKLYHSLVSLRPEKQPIYFEHLDRETKRLENIVEGLLHLSRLDQDRAEINLEPVDLDRMAENFVADRALLAEERGLTLTRKEARKPRRVMGDPALLGQAISVLFTNALNYTPSGGSIILETASASRGGKPGAALSIEDTGPGIPANELPRLFERFFRGTAGRASGVPGTGLGLAIAQEIVERHGGRLEVHSTGEPGKGARFTMWLPGADPQAELDAPGSKVPQPDANDHGSAGDDLPPRPASLRQSGG